MENENNPEPRSSVGSLLRATRVRAGIGLSQISAGLRIRSAYISAIEDNNYQALPGAAYAAGFVRAYADYLGLDSDEVVRRFRAESAGAHTSSQLRFPSPLSERGIPGAALTFVGIIVAAIAYGGWYLSTSENNVVAELVGPLPDRLAALLGSEPGAARPEAEASPRAVAQDGASSPAADTTVAAQGSADPATGGTAVAASPPAVAETAPASETLPASAPLQTATPTQPAPDAGVGAAPAPLPADRPAAVASLGSGSDGGRNAEPVAPAVATATPPVPASARSAPAQQAAAPSVASRASEPAAAAGLPAVRALPSGPQPGTPAATLAQAPPVASPAAAVRSEPAASPPPGPAAQPATVQAQAQATGGEAERPSSTPSPAPGAPGPAAAPRAAPATATAQSPEAPAVAALPASPQPAPPASAANGSRITVRAKLPSWIQVRDDARNELLVTRMMREGDTYPVPDQPGLTLMTGNAGALEILVDGTAVPSVGPLGAVRRNVALDAKRLLDGTAVSE